MLLSLGAPVKPELDLDAEEPPVWDDMLFGDVVDVTFPEVKSQPSLKPDLIDFVDDMPCWNSSPAAKESKRTLRAKRRQARLEAFLRKHDFTEIDSPGVAGLWPIHAAALLGDAKLLRVLMVRGADPDQKTSEGLTPLDYAREKDVEGSHDEVPTGDPPIGMPGEDGDHAPVQGDGDEKAAAQLLEDARGTLRSSVFYGCVAAVVQRFLPHVKTAPGQKLRNSSIFDRYPQDAQHLEFLPGYKGTPRCLKEYVQESKPPTKNFN
ncbi:unnamed protein product, partial [Cladocopium goreaui]